MLNCLLLQYQLVSIFNSKLAKVVLKINNDQNKIKNNKFLLIGLEMIGLEVIGLEMIRLVMIGLEMFAG